LIDTYKLINQVRDAPQHRARQAPPRAQGSVVSFEWRQAEATGCGEAEMLREYHV